MTCYYNEVTDKLVATMDELTDALNGKKLSLTPEQKKAILPLLEQFNWQLKVMLAHQKVQNTQEGTPENDAAWNELVDITFAPVEMFDEPDDKQWREALRDKQYGDENDQ
jgi:hypothetical protein